MAFVGNLKGPRESFILDCLGPNYFGCSVSGLEEDIAFHVDAERRSEVVPVHVDETGKPFIVFSSSDSQKPQRYYLEENGSSLEGEIKTFTDIEQRAWLGCHIRKKNKQNETKLR
jgi:hypothetical protein